MKAIKSLGFHIPALVVRSVCILSFSLLFSVNLTINAQNTKVQDYVEYRGKVVDKETEKPIPNVHISAQGSDIEGLTNYNGVFSLKILGDSDKVEVIFSKVGYRSMNFELVYYDDNFTEIFLDPSKQQLDKVNLYKVSNPRFLVSEVLKKGKRGSGKITGFYREKIDRGRRNVMLSEAVVQIDEKKWRSGSSGRIDVYKSRKRTDYKRLDTIAVKVQGGPFATIRLDLLRYPEFLFADLDDFRFKLEDPTTIDDRYIYVVAFEEVAQKLPWYKGKLFIDAETRALVKADFSLNVDNKRAARRLLLVKNPRHAKVTPLETHYHVDYLYKDGKWYYSYGRFFIELRVNWKKRLFNRRFYVNGEMVITDRDKESDFPEEELHRIRPSTTISDDISGFRDTSFWGPHNIVEPDKTLDKAIDDIRKQIDM